MDAYSKQIQPTSDNTNKITNRGNESSNNQMDENTAEFFNNLNKLATFGQTPLFSMPSVYPQETSNQGCHADEDIPCITTSKPRMENGISSQSNQDKNIPVIRPASTIIKSSAQSSSVFSECRSGSSLEINPSQSSLMIVESIPKDQEVDASFSDYSLSREHPANESTSENEIETIQLPTQPNRKKDLLIEVISVIEQQLLHLLEFILNIYSYNL